jgi:hypothetical protein
VPVDFPCQRGGRDAEGFGGGPLIAVGSVEGLNDPGAFELARCGLFRGRRWASL